MIKKLLLFVSLITSLLASSCHENNGQEENDLLKSMTGKDDIMNIETVFDPLNKVSNGKGKDKDRKKKPKKHESSSSSSSDDDRTTSHRRSRASRPPIVPISPKPSASNEQVMRRQEVVGSRHSRHTSKEDNAGEDNVITVTGPIRRKPLIYKN